MEMSTAYTPLLDWLKTTPTGGFFITGTDTDIGKTFVACQLGRFLQEKRPGLAISARKPIASGAIRNTDNLLYSDDAIQLQQATDHIESLPTICPYLFEAAISPARAIKQASEQGGKPITIKDLAIACQVPDHHFALVEGAGGIYSPLAIDGLNIDLAMELQYPLILVVANRLGCLNHALLTVGAIEKAGLPLAHIFVNNLSKNGDGNTVMDLQNLTPYPISEIPFQPI